MTYAIRVSDFTSSVGVDTHIPYTDGHYANLAIVTQEMQYLGLTNIRDGISNGVDGSAPLASYIQLAQSGFQFTIALFAGGSVTTQTLSVQLSLADQLNAAVPGSVVAVEGANEINNFPLTYNGVGGLQGAINLQRDIYADVKADPTLAHVAVDYFTGYNAGDIGVGPNPETTTDLADFDTQHPYPNNGNAPYQWVNRTQALGNENPPTGPAVYTETGYSTNGGTTGAVNADVQARYTLDLLMDDAKSGISRTYLYQLMDAYQPGSPQGDDGFGLFDPNNQPKEAAVGIHDLTSILSDTGATAASFTPTSLNYSVSGLPATGQSLLLQKSTGEYDLVVWNEPEIWNEATGTETLVPGVDVTVALGAMFQTVNVYDPLIGTAPIASYNNTNSIAVSVSDHPLIIQAQVATGTLSGTTYTLGAAGGTVNSTGPDIVTTGSGSATVNAAGAATISGGSGALHVSLTGSGASVTGGSGNLSLTDAQGGNSITTSTGSNTLSVGLGNDQLVIKGSTNTVTLGGGSDTITVLGNAQLVGGSGTAVITASGTGLNAVTGTGSTLISFRSGSGMVQTHGNDTVTAGADTGGTITVDAEGPATTVTGGSGGLVFSGNGNATVTTANTGTSSFNPGAGTDTFNTLAATSNTIWLGSGVDSVYSAGHDTVHAGSGPDTVTQSAIGTSLTVYASATAMRVNAGSGNTSLIGGSGAATVYGGHGSMEVQEGSGATTVLFAQGNSTVSAGSGADVFTFRAGVGGGTQVIQNFQAGLDHLHLSLFPSNTAAQVVANGHASAAGFTMSLSDGTTIVMAGLSQFSASYFS